jgi:hypothetical protein
MGRGRDHASEASSLVANPVIWIKSARVLVDDTIARPHSHTEWIPKWTTYSDA